MHSLMLRRDGELIGRIEGGLCRDQLPRADAGVLGVKILGSKLKDGDR